MSLWGKIKRKSVRLFPIWTCVSTGKLCLWSVRQSCKLSQLTFAPILHLYVQSIEALQHARSVKSSWKLPKNIKRTGKWFFFYMTFYNVKKIKVYFHFWRDYFFRRRCEELWRHKFQLSLILFNGKTFGFLLRFMTFMKFPLFRMQSTFVSALNYFDRY